MECKVSDLVKRGHDQAVELKSSCGAVDVRDVAQLISDLATQLDVQLARSNALAAENAGLKGANAEGCKWDGEQWVGISIQTPATEAFLAEVRAQGVEMFATKAAEDLRTAGGAWGVIQEPYHEVADYLEDRGESFAAQLRKGVQS
ncbi:TPA: hypothetical protein ACJIWS_000054 [Enterobacter roggenkampii]